MATAAHHQFEFPPVLSLVPRKGRTLEELLLGAWEDLSAHRTATCPVCDGAMEPRYGAGPSAVGGRCRDCRTDLS
jgi:DnaJ-class molecular chaperone